MQIQLSRITWQLPQTEKLQYYIYSFDLILAVGFRVRSKRGTQFRQWVNHNLKEYMIKERFREAIQMKVYYFTFNLFGKDEGVYYFFMSKKPQQG